TVAIAIAPIAFGRSVFIAIILFSESRRKVRRGPTPWNWHRPHRSAVAILRVFWRACPISRGRVAVRPPPAAASHTQSTPDDGAAAIDARSPEPAQPK